MDASRRQARHPQRTPQLHVGGDASVASNLPQRNLVTNAERISRAWTQVRSVHDPELPYLTVEEMGMVRGVRIDQDQLVVTLTPTYSGCPATDVISEDITAAVQAIEPSARVEVVLSPALSLIHISEPTRPY